MKIALVLNDDFSMWHFRKGLISALVNKGHLVYVITPAGPYVSKIESLGAKHIAIPMYRFVSPFADCLLLIRFYSVFMRRKFDIVNTMTIKPNIYGTIAARLAGVPKTVGLVSGLGFIFQDKLGFSLRITKPFVLFFYRIACYLSYRVWFQNSDDKEYFVKHKIIKEEKALVIKSGGIDLYEYTMSKIEQERIITLRKEIGFDNSKVIVTMITARLIWPKGVREFIEASKAKALSGINAGKSLRVVMLL